jgi:DNA-binding NtrC family response regulator
MWHVKASHRVEGSGKNAQDLRIISMANRKPSLSVLVVDDEALLRWSLAEALRCGGHTVIEAASAHEAHDAISGPSESIDVAVLDYRLPDSSDLRLLEEVRRRFPRSAVILMTAYGTPEVVQRALDSGAYRVLTKPFDMHGIAALVSEAYESARYH